MEKKFQVFVSSTRNDLLEARDAAMKAILEIGHIPVGMEMFSAADDDSWTLIKKQIDQSDYYIVIVAHRYGSTDADGISYTEKESDYASSQSIPAFGFVIENSAMWANDQRDSEPQKQEMLQAFKSKVRSKQVAFWNDANSLQARVLATLSKQIHLHDRPGWIRGSSVPSPAFAEEFSRLSRENAELRAKAAVVQPPDIAFEISSVEFILPKEGEKLNHGWNYALEAEFIVTSRNARPAVYPYRDFDMVIKFGEHSLKMESFIVSTSGVGNERGQGSFTIAGPGEINLICGSNNAFPPELRSVENPKCEFTWLLKVGGYGVVTSLKAELIRIGSKGGMITWALPIPQPQPT